MVYSSALPQQRPTPDPAALDAVFGALAHHARRQIVHYLATRPAGPRMHVVAADNHLSPQLLNKHTAALEKAGLVTRVMRGRDRHLVLNSDALDEAQDWIATTRAFWEGQFDSLAAYIAQLNEAQRSVEGQDQTGES